MEEFHKIIKEHFNGRFEIDKPIMKNQHFYQYSQ